MSDQDIERKLEEVQKSVNEFYAINRRNIGRSFVLGIFSALGATLGFAILVAILGFIIKLLGGLPIIGGLLIRIGEHLHK